MENQLNTEQQMNQYGERIISLFSTIEHDIKVLTNHYAKQLDLTGQQLIVIEMLFKNSGINLCDLSEKLKKSKSNVSVIVNSLVGKGIVKREIPKENRRSIRLTLSSEFEQNFITFFSMNLIWVDVFKNATDQELRTTIKALEKCHDLLAQVVKK